MVRAVVAANRPSIDRRGGAVPARESVGARWLPRALLAAALALVVGPACKRQHYGVGEVPDLGYPTCPVEQGAAAAGSAAAANPAAWAPARVERRLRSGSNDTRQTIVERFSIERRGCLWAVTERQEWPMQIADVEALFDEQLRPVRVWRRITAPSSKRADGMADTKRFEFRTPNITIKHRSNEGRVAFEELRAPRKPEVLIGPGRGMISVWLRRARLKVGEKTREAVLDFRGVEKISDITLRRDPDVFVEGLGRTARVYTFLGRETVFADDDDVVIGDLAGLVPDDRAPGRAPPPMPTFQPIDPVGTP